MWGKTHPRWCAHRADASTWCSRLEDRIKLHAILHYLPRAFEPGGNHERVACTELVDATIQGSEAHLSTRDVAELALGIAHAPLAARAGPAAGEELVGGVAEVVRDAL